MIVKVKFNHRNWCVGFWWGKGEQVGVPGRKHLFAIVLLMIGVMFLWGRKCK